jgi:hypothetical protein
MQNRFNYELLGLFENFARYLKTRPMDLGGFAGSGGGEGASAAGYIGWLPQTRVAYDTDEFATLDTTNSGTLLDNLNHIRYRIGQLELSSGILTVDEWDGSPSVSLVQQLTFSGALITDLGGGHALVTFSGGVAGSGLDTAAGDARYLKLDASNDPITGALQIAPTTLPLGVNEALSVIAPIRQALYLESLTNDAIYSVTHNSSFLVLDQKSDSGTPTSDAIFELYRFATVASGGFNQAAIYLEDAEVNNAVFTKGILKHVYNPVAVGPNILLAEINSYAAGTETAIYFDTLETITASGKLIQILNNSVDKFSVNGSGVVDIASGATYNIDGVPHTHSGGSGTPLTVESFGGGTIVNNVDKISIYGAIVADAGSGDVLVLMNDPDSVVPDSVRTKYIITPSISSNNLTIAIKYIDGGDCGPSERVTFRIGDTEYTLNTSASYTKNAGTNWHNSGSTMFAGKDVDYFVYAIAETGAAEGLKFGHCRIPGALSMSDMQSSSTNEKYIAGNYTNFNGTDKVVQIGRFRARLSGTASFNWSIPTVKVVNYPIFETDWLTYLPTYSATAPMTFGTVITDMAIYQLRGFCQEVKADFHGTTGGTATNVITFTLPLSTNGIVSGLGYGTAYVLDAVASAGYWRTGAVLPIGLAGLEVLKADETVFGLGASRYTRGSIILPI